MMKHVCRGYWVRLGVLCLVAMGIVALLAPTEAAAAQSVRMAVTDLEGLEQMQREFGAFKGLLEKYSGYEVKFFPVPNRTAAVEAVKAKKVEFVLTGPAEYVIFKQLTNAQAVVGFSRPDYYCSVVVLADSGINNVKDLKSKKVAIGSVGSTSKHLAPMQIFADNGLQPRNDLKVVHTGVDLGWEALKRGDVAAWGMTTDKFHKLRGREKELEPGAFKVIARGPDLPNDVLLVAQHVEAGIVNKFRKVFLERSDELVSAILQGEDNKKYRGMKFLTSIKDSDYDYVRMMYRTIGYPQFSSFVGD